ncbi:LutC/YkgG family protein [Intrasporangium sp. YIM S08009]|uniref:LutC/YkgG family protein n=1 Tax=Intrasporangium zincisolvens TaxID=3080018 RepID=UPI002B0591A5|nr:LUD domain-containing protein [Intrasporangium sp. YIM S08009]
MSARDEVLARVRDALGPTPDAPDVPRGYRRVGEHEAGSDALVAQLVDRLEDYRATVVRCGADDVSIRDAVASAVSEALSRKGIGDDDSAVPPLLHAPGLPVAWVEGLASRPDDGSLAARDLDVVAAVVTASVVAVSETGTVVLDGSPACGRRALTLVPDVHVCVLRVADVVQTVPEALARLDPTRPLTFVSGPSATSDIELSRVEGVHGPRTLVVVLAG